MLRLLTGDAGGQPVFLPSTRCEKKRCGRIANNQPGFFITIVVLLASDVMETCDPDIQLSKLRTPERKLCFYPSSGWSLLWAVMSLNSDVFVFADYGPQTPKGRDDFWVNIATDFRKNHQRLTLVESTERTRLFKSGDKWGFLFFQDNNEVLNRVVKAGWQVNTFVGIRDGCGEGGNYECVHENPFLTKLLASASNPLTYFTNHSRLLTDYEESGQRNHLYFKPLVIHDSRYEFALRCVLVFPDGLREIREFQWRSGGYKNTMMRNDDLRAFFPSTVKQSPSFYISHQSKGNQNCDLLRLSDFRVSNNEGVIAQYEVGILKPH